MTTWTEYFKPSNKILISTKPLNIPVLLQVFNFCTNKPIRKNGIAHIEQNSKFEQNIICQNNIYLIQLQYIDDPNKLWNINDNNYFVLMPDFIFIDENNKNFINENFKQMN